MRHTPAPPNPNPGPGTAASPRLLLWVALFFLSGIPFWAPSVTPAYGQEPELIIQFQNHRLSFSNTDGRFTLGTRIGEPLLEGFPTEDSSSRANFMVDDLLYSNHPAGSNPIRPVGSPTTMDSTEVRVTYHPGPVTVDQVLRFEPFTFAGSARGTSLLNVRYTFHNPDSLVHQVGLVLLYNVRLGADAHPQLFTPTLHECCMGREFSESEVPPNILLQTGDSLPSALNLMIRLRSAETSSPPERLIYGDRALLASSWEPSYIPGPVFSGVLFLRWGPFTLAPGESLNVALDLGAVDPPRLLLVDAGPDRTIALGDSTFLGGVPSAFGGHPPYTYLWTPPAGLVAATASNPAAAPTVPTRYQLLVTDSLGNLASDQVIVHVGDDTLLPELTITGPDWLCPGDSAILTAHLSRPADDFFWPSPGGRDTLVVVRAAGNYCAQGTWGGIVLETCHEVRLAERPGVTLSQYSDSLGTTFLLAAPSVGSHIYDWSRNDSELFLHENPIPAYLSGRYTVRTQNNAGCLSEPATVDVTVGLPGDLALVIYSAFGTPLPGGTVYYHAGDTVVATVDSMLFAEGRYHRCIGWRGTGSTPFIGSGNRAVFPISRGSTLTWLWSSDLTATLVVDAGPDQAVHPRDLVTVGGDSVVTGGMLPYSYSWSPSFAVDRPRSRRTTLMPTDTTVTLVLRVSDFNVNTGEDSVTIYVVPPPFDLYVNAGPDHVVPLRVPVPLVEGLRVVGAQGPVRYNWFPATGLSDPTAAIPTLTCSDSTTYQLTATDSLGRFGVATVTVRPEMTEPLTVWVEGPERVCPGDTLLLVAHSYPIALGYNWGDGSTGESLWVVGPGHYCVTGTLGPDTAQGCAEVAAARRPSVQLELVADSLGHPWLHTSSDDPTDILWQWEIDSAASSITDTLWALPDPLDNSPWAHHVCVTWLSTEGCPSAPVCQDVVQPVVTLDITSSIPAVAPAAGRYFSYNGELLQAAVISPIAIHDTTWECLGYLGTGSLADSSGALLIRVPLLESSTLTWLWRPLPEPETTYVLSGTVRDEMLSPLGDVEITLWNAETSRVLFTDPLGTFRFTLSEGAYLLRADGRTLGYRLIYWDGTEDSLAADTIALSSDTPADFILTPALGLYRVCGLVRDRDFRPVPDIRVVAISTEDERFENMSRTNARGRFWMDFPAAGWHLLMAGNAGTDSLVPTFLVSSPFWSAAESVHAGYEPSVGHVLTIWSSLHGGVYSVSGTVIERLDGKAPLDSSLADTRVLALDDGNEVADWTLSLADGSYRLDALTAGTFRVMADRAGYLPVEIETLSLSAANPAITGLPLVLQRTTSWVPSGHQLESLGARIIVRPNPFESTLSIDLGTLTVEAVAVLDISGRSIGEMAVTGKLLTWDGLGVDGLPVPAGTYLLRFRLRSGDRVVPIFRLP